MASYGNIYSLYNKISTATELLEKLCPFGPHIYKTKGKKLPQSELWFNFNRKTKQITWVCRFDTALLTIMYILYMHMYILQLSAHSAPYLNQVFKIDVKQIFLSRKRVTMLDHRNKLSLALHS